MHTTSVSPENYRYSAFGLGFEYYCTGRYAAVCGFMPLAGNLFHHAIEMLLKGTLARHIGISKLRGLSHQLPDIWRELRCHVIDPALATFDGVIRELHKFEHIRYPENLVREGAMLALSFQSGSRTFALSKHAEPEYELCVEDVDMLVAALFKAGSINPEALHPFNEHAEKYLRHLNAKPIR
jgi:hypothetical protein